MIKKISLNIVLLITSILIVNIVIDLSYNYVAPLISPDIAVTSIIILSVLIFILLKKLTLKFKKSVIVVAIFLILGFGYLYKPFKILKGDVGPYKRGSTVLAYSSYLRLNKQFNPGKVVVFDGSTSIEYVGVIERRLDSGEYEIKLGEKTLKISPRNIKFVVWYPIRK